MEQKSRMTAFINTDDGIVVECWEIDDLLPDSVQQNARQHGSKDSVRLKQMSVGEGGVTGIDILTWPAPATIYPPPSGYHSNAGLNFNLFPSYVIPCFYIHFYNSMFYRDLIASSLQGMNGLLTRFFFFFSSFTVKGGLIYIESISLFSKSAAEPEQYLFDVENGDDWFYFEDTTTSNGQCAKTASNPLTISTRSSTETTLIRFKYDETPKHTVLHSGRCHFAGLKPAGQSSKGDKDLGLARLTVQDY